MTDCFFLLRSHLLKSNLVKFLNLNECLLLIGIFIQVIYKKAKKSDVEDFFENIKKGAPANSEKTQDIQ